MSVVFVDLQYYLLACCSHRPKSTISQFLFRTILHPTYLHSKQARFIKPRSDYSLENYLMPYNIKILQPSSLLDLPQMFVSLPIFPLRFLKICSVVSLRNPGNKPANRTRGRTRPSWRKAKKQLVRSPFQLCPLKEHDILGTADLID